MLRKTATLQGQGQTFRIREIGVEFERARASIEPVSCWDDFWTAITLKLLGMNVQVNVCDQLTRL